MKRRRLLAVVAAAGTTGCLRLTGDGGTPTEPSPTDGGGSGGDTPTPGVTQSPPRTTRRPATTDGTPAEYPIGLSDEGVSLLLVDNHVTRLAKTSFTKRFTNENVTHSRVGANELATVEGARALSRHRHVGTDIFWELDTKRSTWRTTVGRETVYGSATKRHAATTRQISNADVLGKLIAGGAYAAPERISTADGPRFRIEADGVGNTEPLIAMTDAAEIEGFTASGRVSAEGVVRTLTATLRFISSDERLIEERFEYEVSGLGSTSVSEPSWLPTAEERAPRIGATLRDGRIVVYRHEGGDPVVPQTRVTLRSPDRGGETGLAEEFTEGETLYVAVDEADGVVLERGGPPDTAGLVELDDDFYTSMSVNHGTYFKSSISNL